MIINSTTLECEGSQANIYDDDNIPGNMHNVVQSIPFTDKQLASPPKLHMEGRTTILGKERHNTEHTVDDLIFKKPKKC